MSTKSMTEDAKLMKQAVEERIAKKRRIAAAIANARGNRRGVPTITNILDMLPAKLLEEVMDDAEAVLRAMGK